MSRFLPALALALAALASSPSAPVQGRPVQVPPYRPPVWLPAGDAARFDLVATVRGARMIADRDLTADDCNAAAADPASLADTLADLVRLMTADRFACVRAGDI